MTPLNQSLYVMIDMGEWKMALPQSDVVSVELLSDAICTRKKRRLIWWISWQDQRVEILALDALANKVDVEEVTGNALVLLGDGKVPSLGLACNNLEVVAAHEIENAIALPRVMSKALSLFDRLAMRNGELVCISELHKLDAYLHQEAAL